MSLSISALRRPLAMTAVTPHCSQSSLVRDLLIPRRPTAGREHRSQRVGGRADPGDVGHRVRFPHHDAQ